MTPGPVCATKYCFALRILYWSENLGKKRRKRELESVTMKATSKSLNSTEVTSDDYYAYEDEDDYSTRANETKSTSFLLSVVGKICYIFKNWRFIICSIYVLLLMEIRLVVICGVIINFSP